jgi:L-2-hydroxycarboxylate dehydrogenase (NAD+)
MLLTAHVKARLAMPLTSSLKMPIIEATQLMGRAALEAGCPASEVAFVVAHYLDAERAGKRTHGVVKFLKEASRFSERVDSPSIEYDSGAMVKLNGNREIGPTAARIAVDIAIERADTHGIALVGMTNIQRYGVLGPFAERCALRGLIGIVMNGCEPAMLAPGSRRPVLGSNPLAIAIPTTNAPIIIDMATTKAPMSTLLVSEVFGEPLPQGVFRDAEGSETDQPDAVRGADSFAGFKGFALGLAIEVLSGSLVGAAMGSRILPPYDIGYTFIAIKPSRITTMRRFLDDNDALIDELREGLLDSDAPIIPGERARRSAASTDHITITEGLYQELCRMASK